MDQAVQVDPLLQHGGVFLSMGELSAFALEERGIDRSWMVQHKCENSSMLLVSVTV